MAINVVYNIPSSILMERRRRERVAAAEAQKARDQQAYLAAQRMNFEREQSNLAYQRQLEMLRMRLEGKPVAEGSSSPQGLSMSERERLMRLEYELKGELARQQAEATGERNRENIESREKIADERNRMTSAQGNLNRKHQESMQRLRGEQSLGEIAERSNQTMRQIEERGRQAKGLAELKAQSNIELQNLKGAQRLEQMTMEQINELERLGQVTEQQAYLLKMRHAQALERQESDQRFRAEQGEARTEASMARVRERNENRLQLELLRQEGQRVRQDVQNAFSERMAKGRDESAMARLTARLDAAKSLQDESYAWRDFLGDKETQKQYELAKMRLDAQAYQGEENRRTQLELADRRIVAAYEQAMMLEQGRADRLKAQQEFQSEQSEARTEASMARVRERNENRLQLELLRQEGQRVRQDVQNAFSERMAKGRDESAMARLTARLDAAKSLQDESYAWRDFLGDKETQKQYELAKMRLDAQAYQGEENRRTQLELADRRIVAAYEQAMMLEQGRADRLKAQQEFQAEQSEARMKWSSSEREKAREFLDGQRRAREEFLADSKYSDYVNSLELLAAKQGYDIEKISLNYDLRSEAERERYLNDLYNLQFRTDAAAAESERQREFQSEQGRLQREFQGEQRQLDRDSRFMTERDRQDFMLERDAAKREHEMRMLYERSRLNRGVSEEVLARREELERKKIQFGMDRLEFEREMQKLRLQEARAKAEKREIDTSVKKLEEEVIRRERFYDYTPEEQEEIAGLNEQREEIKRAIAKGEITAEEGRELNWERMRKRLAIVPKIPKPNVSAEGIIATNVKTINGVNYYYDPIGGKIAPLNDLDVIRQAISNLPEDELGNKDFTRLYDLIVAIDRSRKLYGDRKSAEAESPQRVRVEDGVKAKSVGEYFK